MTAPGKEDYGLGVEIVEKGGLKLVQHSGGIEGFNTALSHAPEKDITIVVLSNVNGRAPDTMAAQLLDVVLGKPVILPEERKAMPIDAKELSRFLGTYDLAPTFAITIATSPNGAVLTAQATNQAAFPLSYEGVIEGHPRFFTKAVDAEIEFVPDASGTITSLVLHQGGEHLGKKR
jgi:CubicO group peptidase (beta-lactamase class C family)